MNNCYDSYFSAVKEWVTVRRWKYVPDRGLRIECKCPQKPDNELKEYMLPPKTTGCPLSNSEDSNILEFQAGKKKNTKSANAKKLKQSKKSKAPNGKRQKTSNSDLAPRTKFESDSDNECVVDLAAASKNSDEKIDGTYDVKPIEPPQQHSKLTANVMPSLHHPDTLLSGMCPAAYERSHVSTDVRVPTTGYDPHDNRFPQLACMPHVPELAFHNAPPIPSVTTTGLSLTNANFSAALIFENMQYRFRLREAEIKEQYRLREQERREQDQREATERAHFERMWSGLFGGQQHFSK